MRKKKASEGCERNMSDLRSAGLVDTSNKEMSRLFRVFFRIVWAQMANINSRNAKILASFTAMGAEWSKWRDKKRHKHQSSYIGLIEDSRLCKPMKSSLFFKDTSLIDPDTLHRKLPFTSKHNSCTNVKKRAFSVVIGPQQSQEFRL